MSSNEIALRLAAFLTSASLALAQSADPPAAADPGTLLENPLSVTPGEGITFDGGDEFMLNLRNLLQVRWECRSLDRAQSTQDFDVRRARTYFSGHAFAENIEYELSLEWTDPAASPPPGVPDTVLKDAWVQWNFFTSRSSRVGVRVGQTRTFYGLQATAWEGGLEYPERSVATRTFAGPRSRGVFLRGAYLYEKIFWNLGVINGDVAGASGASILETGEETDNPDTLPGFAGSLGFDLLGAMGQARYEEADLDDSRGRLTVRGGIAYGNNRAAPALGGPLDVKALSLTGGTALKMGGSYFAGEYFYREDDPEVGLEESSQGLQFQYSYTTAPASAQYSLGARVGFIDLDEGSTWLPLTRLAGGAGDILELGGVFNVYVQRHRLKTQLAYTYLDTDPNGLASTTDHIFEVQVQLVF